MSVQPGEKIESVPGEARENSLKSEVLEKSKLETAFNEREIQKQQDFLAEKKSRAEAFEKKINSRFYK